ncbi:DUF4931 domain-containing protein [Tumebacillus sp. DT12]|uniref:DUF4931 domain-containing protein n=1 Tax=Tumebacillus lacus TaxID=2995335 RepID=A0ABT3WWQ7_9BACL|nr:DUF4931 domain-containing protein [Tumebacillus lacus]MCX7569118.1 DUF4931 domain-containing protein [Tumebacillus lacus]
MTNTHLHFDSHLSKQKPNSIIQRDTSCPFCDREQLDEILAEQGPILLVKNKFPTLKDTLQTVLIETDTCESEFATYEREHLHALIRFGVEEWLRMSESGAYTSVIFYKNHGPYSGGSIHHPHMQIVGLKDVDYRDHMRPDHFVGHTIAKTPGVTFNVSTLPRIGFFEFNVLLHDFSRLDRMADYIQVAAHYTLHHFHKSCNSYNLFFYQLENGEIACKIVPRFVTTPIFVGFSIPQVSDRIADVAAQIQEIYFAK